MRKSVRKLTERDREQLQAVRMSRPKLFVGGKGHLPVTVGQLEILLLRFVAILLLPPVEIRLLPIVEISF